MSLIRIIMICFIITRSAAFLTKQYRHSNEFKSISTFKSSTTRLQSFSTQSVSSARPKKYIVVTGGVISGIGKGITASSVGVVLKMLGLKPTAMKIDPYLNVDAGTMSPFEHGETFVLDDGAECDLDLGNYERFLDVKLTHDSSLTTGKIYQAVIAKERKGDYLGKTVQIIPHITDEIMNRIVSVSHQPVQPVQKTYNHDDGNNSNNNQLNNNEEPDVCIIELGGTIGDIESMPFVEAIRQLQLKVKPVNLCIVHVSMVPTVGDNGEQKTKPTQHSVKELRSLGLAPDFIVCRSKVPLDSNSRTKISLFCNVPVDNVLSVYDLSNIYHAPLVMIQQNFHQLLAERMGLVEAYGIALPSSSSSSVMSSNDNNNNNLADNIATTTGTSAWSGLSTLVSSTIASNSFYKSWVDMANRMDRITDEVTICIIGKYTNQGDSYLSLVNAIKHSCVATNQKLKLIMIESTSLEKFNNEGQNQQESDVYISAWEKLKSADGVVVPGGFGYRGVEGKIEAIRYVREQKIPFLGVCLGMQMAVIEYARHVLGYTKANSEEFVPVVTSVTSGSESAAVSLSQRRPEETAVVFMPEGSRDTMGGTMRLGSRTTVLKDNTIAMTLYNTIYNANDSSNNNSISNSNSNNKQSTVPIIQQIDERHRHRYEVNPGLVSPLEAKGLIFSGKDVTGERMEIIELSSVQHPYFLGCQFHPEYKSRPLRPAPLFLGLLQAIQRLKREKRKGV